MSQEFDTDLFVIGGGSGGVRAARIAAGHGARVMLAEEYRVGGTCVIRGCVPKKLMVYAGRFADEFEDAAGFGWSIGTPRFDWSVLKERRDAEVTRLEGIYTRNLAASGVDLIADRAAIEDPHTVRLCHSGRLIRAKTILVAVGAAPVNEPMIPGGDLAIDSNGVFELERQPERILVIGGGYIAVEFAGVFAALGSRTTLLHRGEKLLRGFDDEVRDALGEAYAQRMDLRLNRTVERLERDGAAIRATLSDGETLTVDCVLGATGRRPNVTGLGLENVGIATKPNGAIPVDDYSQTTMPSIYAVGDVTNRAALTPIAIREGHAFADTVFGGKPWCVDHRLIPTAVFSTPEIGVVGHNEDVARACFDAIDVYRSSFRPMKATLSGRDERTLMKVLVDKASDRVVGVHVLGHDAGEIIQAVGIAVTMGATKADFDRTIAVHPTGGEELVTMRSPVVTKHPVGVG
ncbi:glutathione-disulfide reductase [Methylobacterium haplocladii]|uniref:Glutathione-disulfide reductase n=1 Tax=Methylobacterium haplocladii TaxID=1176176 RepID=A0A512IT97_9HYPH|nr:glutathione-disulfide reductase [Methylobacterium haplocladii]GEP00911.1 glutathione-disulfide reductase [Methylobacterium haplocladii]GJD82237.1 Glutathione amide reductase [Methylobacterium haplocladii]GLS58857.1 glutathione-disulfide reductase [Methylobacterium haplocladii]